MRTSLILTPPGASEPASRARRLGWLATCIRREEGRGWRERKGRGGSNLKRCKSEGIRKERKRGGFVGHVYQEKEREACEGM